jgi:hypothetical protein
MREDFKDCLSLFSVAILEHSKRIEVYLAPNNGSPKAWHQILLSFWLGPYDDP